MACDIHFKKVALLLDFDGTSGSTTFTDLSSFGNVVTPQNGAAVSTTAPKFGTGCLPTVSGYLTATNTPAGPLDLATGDWTVECWVKVNNYGTGSTVRPLMCFGTVDVDGVTQATGFRFGTYFNGTNGMAVFLSQTVGFPLDFTYGGDIPTDGNWHAVAVERYNQTIAVYIDGHIITTGPLDVGSNISAYTQVYIGRDNLGNTFDGEIDELRITKGYARYRTHDYTPSTTAFGVACVGEQPVVPVMEDPTYPGQWASVVAISSGFPNYILSYDPPTWQDPDTFVGVLFALSFAVGSAGDVILPANVTATYGGQPCQAYVQDINPVGSSYSPNERGTLLLYCNLPVGSAFTSNELHFSISGTVGAPTFLVNMAATSLLVDPAYVLCSPSTQQDTSVLGPVFSLTIPSYTAPINHLMASVFNCAESSPGTPILVSSPTFHVDADITSGFPIGIASRQLLSGPESNSLAWEYSPTSGPVTAQDFWGNTFSLPPAPFGVEVPSVIGDTPTDADAEIISAGFVVGTVTSAPSNDQPAGFVFFQNPAGGFFADPGTVVDYIISTGPSAVFVPNVVGETVDQANSDITGAGFQVGPTSTAHSDTVPAGVVISQQPPGGTQAALGTFVSYVISSGPQPPPPPTTGTKFDFEATVISQYANSPTLLQLCSNMNDYVDQSTNFATWFDYVWNVNTAQGFGLDIWGKIVNISRLLTIPNTSRNFGFRDNVTPPDYDPFNVSPFNSKGGGATQTYLLNDAAYRTLILTKALSNISATTAPAINQLLRNLFPGRGRCYVLDLGGMAMQFTFEFQLTVTEFAILAQSKALPRPAGVAVNIVTLSGGPVLGFEEAGGGAESFGFGHFY